MDDHTHLMLNPRENGSHWTLDTAAAHIAQVGILINEITAISNARQVGGTLQTVSSPSAEVTGLNCCSVSSHRADSALWLSSRTIGDIKAFNYLNRKSSQ